MALTDKLTAIGNAIREKTGKSDMMTMDEMVTEIGGITTGGGNDETVFDKFIANGLTEIVSNAKSIREYAFYEYGKLELINFPEATIIYSYAFYNCKKLKFAVFPKVTHAGYYTFKGCTSLISASFPEAGFIGNLMFYQCRNLISASFPKATSIGSQTFDGCQSLTTLILRLDDVVKLLNTSAFSACSHFHGTVDSTYNPNGLKDGYIYVPRDLVESYQSATNWSTLSTQFRALEDYTVDGTTTGELDPDKI